MFIWHFRLRVLIKRVFLKFLATLPFSRQKSWNFVLLRPFPLWMVTGVSILSISLQIGSVTLYFILLADAMTREDLPVPKVAEYTAEWQRPEKFLLLIVLFGAYVKTRWCKLSDWLVVDRREMFSRFSQKKFFCRTISIWQVSTLFSWIC